MCIIKRGLRKREREFYREGEEDRERKREIVIEKEKEIER